MQAPVFSMAGDRVREIDLPDEVFGISPNRAVMHQALVRQMANARQGTHDAQDRSEVNRTTAKWYRQKGTGNARHGDRKAPIFIGGGVAHGPHPRSYRKSMPKRMRRLAVRSALSVRASEDAVIVIEGLTLDAPKTRAIRELVDGVADGASTLIVLPGRDEVIERSIRNLSHVRYVHAPYLNVRDILGHDRLVLTDAALEVVATHLGDAEGTAPFDAATSTTEG